jgi:hypothetical protein
MDTKLGLKATKRNAIRASRVKKTAELTGFSESYVRKILNTQRENEKVLEVYMSIVEGENALLDAVRKAVPFPSKEDIKRAKSTKRAVA